MSLYALMENSIQIAWDYLERTGQIDDPEFTSKFLLQFVENAVRTGERNLRVPAIRGRVSQVLPGA
jgi:hypothetical protein